MKIKISASVFLLIVCLGCHSRFLPEYTLIGSDMESAMKTGKGVHIKGGWEFRFIEVYDIQVINIHYNGILSDLIVYYKTDRGWEKAKVVNDHGSYPFLIELDVKTDAIRVFPKFSGNGSIASCEFNFAKKQKVFSMPLEKPPFIK